MKTQHVYGAVIHCFHGVLQFLIFLVALHWMTGIANVAMTAILGISVLRIGRFLRYRSQTLLRLRRVVLLVALIKGAFYFVMGESLHAASTWHWIVGVQFPYPGEALGLVAQTGYSIWHPTAISGVTSLILTSAATIYLVARAAQLRSAARDISALQTIVPKNEHADEILRLAADVMAVRPAQMPRLIVLSVLGKNRPVFSPLLLGVKCPFLLIPQQLIEKLTDLELELVMRHELAHLVRRDHWWRWLLLWVVDVGAATILAYPVRAAAVETEEQLCDRLAIRSPQEALFFAKALQKIRNIISDDVYPAGPPYSPRTRRASLLGAVTPFLVGNYASLWQYPSVVPDRLKSLLAWSEELSAHMAQGKRTHTSTRTSASRILSLCGVVIFACGRLIIALLLAMVLYAKYHLALNLYR